ncbi:hypothetical protein EVAR_100354_1 [Eumeta japonica]|uniref:Uncharacterized protein n=1 Tax=Eumeta variegata TaxID=151549 RepID=A0A4C2AHK1_EUMVA|nr:hypothetical protein EVAR_100354_1 [Eumeta japonica]
MQQQYAPPAPRPPPQQLKSPLHEHANGFAPLCEAASPTPKGGGMGKPQKAPHSPPQHKYQHVSHPHPQHAHHQQHQQQMVGVGNGRSGGGMGGAGGGGGGGGQACRASRPPYPSPIQRPMAPGLPPVPQPAQAAPPPARPSRCIAAAARAYTQLAQAQSLQPPVRHQPYYQTQQQRTVGRWHGYASAHGRRTLGAPGRAPSFEQVRGRSVYLYIIFGQKYDYLLDCIIFKQNANGLRHRCSVFRRYAVVTTLKHP